MNLSTVVLQAVHNDEMFHIAPLRVTKNSMPKMHEPLAADVWYSGYTVLVLDRGCV